MKTSLLVLGLLLVSVTAFYDGTGDVFKLTGDNIKELVHESDDFWLVEFFAPWCGHCKKLTPEWERAAKGLKGMVKMGAVDMTTDAEAGEGLSIEGYPTLKWFGENKAEPEEFDGGRTSTGIINYAAKKLKEIANSRIGNKKRPKKEKPAEEKKEEEAAGDDGDDDVIVVTDDNFAELVEESTDAWFIEFYAPWCGHCKNLVPVWKKLATAMKGQVKIAKVDATTSSGLGQRFGVKGYPSLKFFPGGAKSDSLVEEYNGGRDLDALQQFAETQSAMSLPAKFKQMTGQESYDEYCTNNKGVCVIVFLPSLYESSAEQRNSYISQIEEVANATKGKPFTFLWSEGGQQFEFEEAFQVGGSGFPAVLAVTVKKAKKAVLMQSFGAENLQAFVTKIGSGKQVFDDYKTTPNIKTVAEWDGKDKPKSDEL